MKILKAGTIIIFTIMLINGVVFKPVYASDHSPAQMTSAHCNESEAERTGRTIYYDNETSDNGIIIDEPFFILGADGGTVYG